MSNLFSSLNEKLFLIAGPCVLENELMAMRLAEQIKKLSQNLDIQFIFKASFDKANRTSINSFRGLPLNESIEIFNKIRLEFEIPVLTDIHQPYQAQELAEVIDILQIPAFLCRQTDLILAAGKTQKIVNLKKGQFLSAKEMSYPIEKVLTTKNSKILLTERGTMFGYNDLVVDFRNSVELKALGNYPIVMDVTHSLQSKRKLSPKLPLVLSSASAASGFDGFFFEVHEAPSNALSDSKTVITPTLLNKCLKRIKAIKLLEFSN